jgi:hypothetical protein
MARRCSLALALLSAAGLSGGCRAPELPPAAAPAAPTAARAAPAPAAVAAPIAWASAPDCQAKLQLLEQAVEAGGLPAGERPPIAVVLPGDGRGWDWLALPSVKIAADLPLEVHERDSAAQLEAACLLMIEQPRDQRVGHRLIGRDSVRSFYQSGVRRERNPEYDAAQLRLRQAERAAKDDGLGILKVGDPMLDLFGAVIGGFVAGFNKGSGDGQIAEAMDKLIATPRSRELPTYRAYEFERTTVLAGKEATVPIALLERASGRIWRAELRQRERRELAIVEGLDPRDRDYEGHSAASLTPDEFERWLDEPPRLQLSAITAALHDAAPATAPDAPQVAATTGPPVDVAAIEPGSGPPPPATHAGAFALGSPEEPSPRSVRAAGRAPLVLGQPRRELDTAFPPPPQRPARADPEPSPAHASPLASVVRIHADERFGGGVYVRADLVLTSAQLVEQASVVDVVAADGTRVLGLVAQADRPRNLALVQVSRPGPPVPLYDGPPLAGGTPVEAIVPTAGDLVRAAGRYLGDGPAIGLMPPSAADLAHLDAPALRDAPQATPWFLGDRLVALGLGTPAGPPEGAYHAVRAAEIGAFLAGAGALAALR